ncbi:MAG: UPF0182 family protein [Candidatus Hodarchaeota archaeon]
MSDDNEDWKRKITSSPVRFKYREKNKKTIAKRYLRYIIPIAIVITILAVFWWWPAWYGNINLQSQLYYNKAEALNFIEFYFLNFWSTNFIFNKTALIGAFIGSIIMSLPPDRILLTIIGTKLRFGKPSLLKSLIFWWTIGFVIFYFIGFVLNSNGAFSWTAYLIEKGELTLSPNIIIDAFNILFDPSNTDYITIFTYSNVVLPIISIILGIVIFRLILNIAKNYYLRRNYYYVLANILLILGLFFALGFLSTPLLALDGINLIQIWAIIIGAISLFSFGIVIYLFGKMVYSRDSKNYKFTPLSRKRTMIAGIVILIIIIIPLISSIGPALGITDEAVWNEQLWNKKYQREIEWTRACAGLDMFEEREISNFTLSSTPDDDNETIAQIRQYDQDYAVQSIAAILGTTFEGLADSDIVYINGTEYWVAPKTIRISQFAGDAVKIHTELYDHVEGFRAIETSTGNMVNVSDEEKFNITENYPIFFGESESERFLRQQNLVIEGRLGGYDSDLLLDTGWEGGIEKNTYVYTGAPDGTLKGLEAFWKTASFNLWGYLLRGESQYLINRNIRARVQNILVPNLRIDDDPYLVFDIERGKMYYAVSIYTTISIGSYSTSPILRFLGVCLVDVVDGAMTFFRNPTLNTSNDPTYPLWKYYLDQYPWKDIDSDAPWLKFQLRYPETLFELQLEANYIYHVQDSKTWKRGDDFHERPEEGDLFYIESNLGNGIEFIGLDLVEYQGLEARTLAGMYVVRHGNNFGEAIFYHTRNSTLNLIGPKTARDTYLSEATQEITLIAGARSGNTLLYPLGGSAYYYIPTYSTVGGLQQLKLAGFVEAFTRKVAYGADANVAYGNLENFKPISFELTSNAGNPDTDGSFILNWTTSTFADTYSIFLYEYPITEINSSLTIIADNLPSSQNAYEVSNIANGTHYIIVQAINEFGDTISNYIKVNVNLIPISYEFEMDSTFIFPSEFGNFRIVLENFNETITAPGYDVQVNLSLYTTNPFLNFSVFVPPNYSPTINSSYSFSDGENNFYGVNYTLINTTLFSGEGLILNGYLNCTQGLVIIKFKWILIVNTIEVYVSEEDNISILI